LPPLITCLRNAGAHVSVVDWDGGAAAWGQFDMALLRSTWNYLNRTAEFLDWVDNVAAATTLLNPPAVIRWNIDKHYLTQLAAAGVEIVPSDFIEPGEDAARGLAGFLDKHTPKQLVVKPAIGAGSKDAQRYRSTERAQILDHVNRLLAAGRSALLQPYLQRVDRDGETALIFFAGGFSHAVGKGPLLRLGEPPTAALFAPESIAARSPTAQDLHAAAQIFGALPFEIPLYARIDLIPREDGAPCLLELEMIEPSLFFTHAAGSVERFTAQIMRFAQVANGT
jgi:hypothetical protein